MNILESASKIVFLLLTITACAAFILGKLDADKFMILITGVFAFYFSHKGEQNKTFAGK